MGCLGWSGGVDGGGSCAGVGGPDVGAGEGDKEKWGAGWELCLLQGKGLCCHGIFIPLWEMETCDTPIKSAVVRQDGQPDPAGRAAAGWVSPGGGHSTAGALPTSPTPPHQAPAPLQRVGRVPPASDATDPSVLLQWGHLPAAAPAAPWSRRVPSDKERGQGGAAGTLWGPPGCRSQLTGWAAGCPGRQHRQGCARAALTPPCSAPCPSDQATVAPGVPRVSAPHWHPVPNSAPHRAADPGLSRARCWG